MSDKPVFVIVLDLWLNEPPITVYAWHVVPKYSPDYRTNLTAEVHQGDEVIFPKGQLICATHALADSNEAKAFVLDLVGMDPDKEESSYFKENRYTRSQRIWAKHNGEMVSSECERMFRTEEKE